MAIWGWLHAGRRHEREPQERVARLWSLPREERAHKVGTAVGSWGPTAVALGGPGATTRTPGVGMGLAFWKGAAGGGRTRLCLKLNVSGRKLDVNLKLSTQPLRGLSGATKPLPTRAGRPPACWEPRRASLAISMWQLHVGLGVGLEPRICTARSDLATRAQSRRSHQTAACSRKRARGADSLRGNAPRSRQSLMLSRPEEARGKQCV